jgi:4-diphosphocytidyl-2-C-methyl-D-erythritol kinase
VCSSDLWAFENFDLQNGNGAVSRIADVQEFNSSVFDFLENDFEKVVFEKYSELELIKTELKNFGAEFSSMSGSGATMYGLFNKENSESLKKAFEYYKAKNYFVFIS